jgi:ectoine hydroxylase-related dioxygenase (phytanoyl-CoA dioxygenase family)
MQRATVSTAVSNVPLPCAANVKEAIEHVEEYGVARIANVLTPAEVQEARRRIFEQAAAERERGCAHFEGSPDKQVGGGPNQRVRNLINKGEIFRRIAAHPVAMHCERRLLGKQFLLSSMSANILGTGGTPMGWHMDQMYVGFLPQRVASAILWMLDDFTEENGATLVRPGSHRWKGYEDVLSSKLPAVPITGTAGSIVILDGRVNHNTGTNNAAAPRPALITYYAMPYMRQEENFALSLAPEVMERCSRELLSLLGFEVWFRLGGVDGSESGTLHSRRPSSFSGEWGPGGSGEGV